MVFFQDIFLWMQRVLSSNVSFIYTIDDIHMKHFKCTYSLESRTRENLDDKARNDKEMESLIPKEEERKLKGVYLDLLSYHIFYNRIGHFWLIDFRHVISKMDAFHNHY